MEKYDKLHHGGDIYSYGEQIIDFSANINPLGMPDAVKKAIIESVDACLHYPDPLYRDLNTAIAQYEGVSCENVICGNGAADLIYRLAYGLKPRNALLLSPTFSEYELALQEVKSHVHYYTLLEEDGFIVKEDIVEKMTGMDLVLLCNPNNPTGILTDPEIMMGILNQCKKNNIVLVVDECFLDFVHQGEDYTLKNHIESYDKLLILKAFTKIYAMPGIRLGYGLSSPEMIYHLSRSGQAWPVSVIASNCGIAALKERDYIQKSRDYVLEERLFLNKALTQLGIKTYDGKANYLFFKCNCNHLKEKLIDRQLLIRDCSNYQGLDDGFYRVAVKSHNENRILIRRLKEILSGAGDNIG